MRTNMIHGESLEFNALIKRLKELRSRFRSKVFEIELKNRAKDFNLTAEKLTYLIEIATKQVTFPFKPSENGAAKIPVTTYSDPFNPAGENNHPDTFYIHFRMEEDVLLFIAVTKE